MVIVYIIMDIHELFMDVDMQIIINFNNDMDIEFEILDIDANHLSFDFIKMDMDSNNEECQLYCYECIDDDDL